MNRLKSQGFGKTFMHLLSIWCLNSVLSILASKPTILLSAPTDSIIGFCRIPATPMTADECIILCNCFGFQTSSVSFQSTTAWSEPPVTKQVFSQGGKTMLLMIPFIWGLASKNVTRAFCQMRKKTRVRIGLKEEPEFYMNALCVRTCGQRAYAATAPYMHKSYVFIPSGTNTQLQH